MSNQADHTIVRLRVPPELKKQIEESAEKNNRSQSAEMVARLEQSFESKKENSTYHEIDDLRTLLNQSMETNKKYFQMITELLAKSQ